MAERVLIVEDDASLRSVLEFNLGGEEYATLSAADGEAGWELFRAERPECVITDLKMPKLDGMALLERIVQLAPETVVIVITAYGTIDRAVEAMKKGATDFVTKPFGWDLMRLTLQRALERRRLIEDNTRLRSELKGRYHPDGMIGASDAMQVVFDTMRRVAASDVSVLIVGESGTGKELIARGIHVDGPRAEGPFVAVNCGAIPADLVESELFGHVKGAFTGATTDRVGRFQRAQGGTLFLDEITELPANLQVKLLRAIAEREIEPVGGTATVNVDVRLIAATNADIQALIAAGEFRRDLYYRLNVVTIPVPPLRDRGDDVVLLAEEFVRQESEDRVRLETATITQLRRHRWPGNVRELENAIRHALVMRADPERITPDDLPATLTAERLDPPVGTEATASVGEGIELFAVERSLLESALREARGNQSKAARLLGISRQTFLYRLKKYSIGKEPGAPV